MFGEPSLVMIRGVVILDNNGKRLYAKYYNPPGMNSPPSMVGAGEGWLDFEKKLYQKTCKANSEIIMLDGITVVYRSNVDVYFYVLGSQSENELILAAVLNCLYDSCCGLMKLVERSFVIRSLDKLMLAIDEIIDDGVFMESDHTQVIRRVAVKGEDLLSGDQTVANVLSNAREQLKWSLLR